MYIYINQSRKTKNCDNDSFMKLAIVEVWIDSDNDSN